MSENNKLAYLAGAMEFTTDRGAIWRRRYSEALEECGITSISPLDGEDKIKKGHKMRELKKTDIDQYIDIMRQIIDRDLTIVRKVDMLVVSWEGEVSTGTCHEVGYAYQLGKPCYLVTSMSDEDVPGWFLACFTERFSTLEKLVDFLGSKQ